ncbi:MAG: extracellular solute-binding protein [Ardenticatenaceae bacterium]|nr:extracellular solute-binding protein [Anaerolineales bacterium]MCB8917108.1 extracellular solute-binding protein [Ardenticatenaceae bacterium]
MHHMNQRRRPPGPTTHAHHPLMALLLLAMLLLSACKPAFLDPPRLATASAMAATPRPAGTTAPERGTPLVLPAPTPTGGPQVTPPPPAGGTTNPTLTFWANQTTPEEAIVLQQIVDNFTAAHNIDVELFLVEPELLPDLMQTAVVSDDIALPDILLLPLEYTVGWAEAGILDPVPAGQVVASLDPATFDPVALDLVQVEGGPAAVPSDGWQQLLIYRQDWFDQRNLAPPLDFTSMITAGQTISDRLALRSGFVIPTESSLVATSRVFEQMAIANGCQLIDEKGELLILEPACQDALEFYRLLCNSYCPPGVQTEVSARNAYLNGRTGMIMAPPSILPQIAGLDPAASPNCPDCTTTDYLARNAGIVTRITGRGPAASAENLGNLTYLGVTTAANSEAATAFLQYWYNEAYLDWLAVNPEMKVPMRLGTPENPSQFRDAWFDLPMTPGGPTVSDVYGAETAAQLATGVANPNRWGFTQGHGALITDVYQDLMLSILLQELLSGYYDSSRAAIEGYKRLVDLIPNYAYYVEPEATATPFRP